MATKVTIERIKLAIKTTKVLSDGKRMFEADTKKMVIQFHYQSGMSIPRLAQEIDINNENIYAWKRIYGIDQTAFVHGTMIRNDVRTKALAVREVIEGGKESQEIAIKYGVSTQSVNTWIRKYELNYKSLIDAPDGIPYIIKDKKMVFGKSNIDKIRAILNKQANELMCLIETMHMSGAQAEAMKKCAEETLKKEDELAEAANLLSDNGIELK